LSTTPAIVVVGPRINAKPATNGLTRRTIDNTSTTGAKLAGAARDTTTSAVRTIRTQVTTDTSAIGLTRRTDTGSSRAEFSSFADVSTSAAVIGVGLFVHTGIITDRLTSRAGKTTPAIGAGFAANAGNTAFSAVFTICQRIDAGGATKDLTCGTNAFANSTNGSTSTASSTGSTVLIADFGVHAKVSTHNLTRRTGHHTLATCTKLAGCTLVAALATVGAVGVRVTTNAGAIELTARTTAFAGEALLSAGTLAITGTTVVIAGLEIGADVVADTLSAGAGNDALASRTEFTGFAGLSTSSTVDTIAHQRTTDTGAISLAFRANTLATGAGFAARAGISAATTVVVVGFRVYTDAGTIALSR
jgi:hypothetical protein